VKLSIIARRFRQIYLGGKNSSNSSNIETTAAGCNNCGDSLTTNASIFVANNM